MKTNLLKSAVWVASLFGALGSASAETLYARIPFNSPHVLLFANEETKIQTMVFVRLTPAAPVKPASPLTFTADSSEHMELTRIATDASAYELSTHPAGRALKGVALTLASGGK